VGFNCEGLRAETLPRATPDCAEGPGVLDSPILVGAPAKRGAKSPEVPTVQGN